MAGFHARRKGGPLGALGHAARIIQSKVAARICRSIERPARARSSSAFEKASGFRATHLPAAPERRLAAANRARIGRRPRARAPD